MSKKQPKALTQEQFNSARDRYVSSDPLTRMINISQLDLEGLKDTVVPHIKIGDKKLRVADGFIEMLGNRLGISKRLQNTFNKKETRKIEDKNGKKRKRKVKVEDREAKIALIDAINKYRKGKGAHVEIMLHADADTKIVTDALPANRAFRLSNRSAFTFAERMMNQFPELSAYSITGTQSGNLVISLQAMTDVKLNIPGSKDDESYYFGMSIVSTPKDTYLTDYNTRLTCINGMQDGGFSNAPMSSKFKDLTQKVRLNAVDPDSIDAGFQWADALKKAQWVPPMFEYTIQQATETYASVQELIHYYERFEGMLKESDPTILQQQKLSLRDNWFQGIKMAQDRLAKKGKDIAIYGEDARRCIRSSMTIWDLVNTITDLASNNHGYDFDRRVPFLKDAAGRLLAQESYDLSHAELYSL